MTARDKSTPTARQVACFQRICRDLRALLDEIRRDNSEAQFYLCDAGLCLMKGETHSDAPNSCGVVARQDNVVACENIGRAGGGDW
jgi:hypothetical protein